MSYRPKRSLVTRVNELLATPGSSPVERSEEWMTRALTLNVGASAARASVPKRPRLKKHGLAAAIVTGWGAHR
jgi:hypothetical protein